MQPRGNPQATRVHEWTHVKGFCGSIRLDEGPDDLQDGLFAEVSLKQASALAQTARMSIGAEEKNFLGILWIGQATHAAKRSCAVVQGVGGH